MTYFYSLFRQVLCKFSCAPVGNCFWWSTRFCCNLESDVRLMSSWLSRSVFVIEAFKPILRKTFSPLYGSILGYVKFFHNCFCGHLFFSQSHDFCPQYFMLWR